MVPAIYILLKWGTVPQHGIPHQIYLY